MLPEEIKKKLADDFHFSAQKMADSSDLATKMYFFSAFFGEAGRALNFGWDSDLSLVHMVCQSTYQQITSRLNLITSGTDRVVGIPKEFPEAITKVAEDIAALYAREKMDRVRLLDLLNKLAELSYVTTGNGHYLHVRGKIKINL